MGVTTIELKKIAHDINVRQDPNESEIDWKRRVIYSACGRQSLASLWDCTENDTVSVQHFKSRCAELLEAFETLFPEIVSLANYGDCDPKIIECMYECYFTGGQFYHKRNRLAPSKYVRQDMGGVSIIKGIYATDTCFMSGLGPYQMEERAGLTDKPFHFNHPDSAILLNNFEKNTQWHEAPNDIQNYSFLRTKPPFKRGYWIDKCDTEQGITLVRYMGDGQSPKQYFLAKVEEGCLMVSDLPAWISKNRMHVYLSLEILKRYESLPPIIMSKYTTKAVIDISYRLPPEEDIFLRMYSWPLQYDGEDRPFKRIIPIELFSGMKSLFIQLGFEVQEVQA